MHRAKWLAENILNKSNEKILFTTFTRNLAEDIKSNLRKICTPEIMKKIDVVNSDAWVIDFLKKHKLYNEPEQRGTGGKYERNENESVVFSQIDIYN